MHSTFKNLPTAHTAVERAFLAVDLQAGRNPKRAPLTQRQAAMIVGVSLSYVVMAAAVAKHPTLRRRVEQGGISLVEAAREVRGVPPKPAVPDLLTLSKAASAAERARVMRYFRDEALEVVDAETAPRNGNGHRGNGHAAIHIRNI